MTLMKLSPELRLLLLCRVLVEMVRPLGPLMVAGGVISELGDLGTGKDWYQVALHQLTVYKGSRKRATVHHIVPARGRRMAHFVRVMVIILRDYLALKLLLVQFWSQLGCIMALDNSDC